MRVTVHQFDGVTTFQALPLAAGLLVASARRDERVAAGVQLRVQTARIDPEAAVSQADVYAFSTYVWNERYSLEVARRAKRRFPSSFVVLGGPSVPRRPERAERFLREHDFVDALVFGEGELVFRTMLRALLDRTPLEVIPGLALHTQRGVHLTGAQQRIADPDQTGSPYLDGTFDALLDDGMTPNAAVIETNRGCPFACTFCDWGQAVQSRVNEWPMERVRRELAWITRRRIPYLYIVDANFGIRRRDVDIIREIVRVKQLTGFPQYVYFHLTKNATERHLEVVLALSEAGIGTHLALSAQDFEPRVLLAVRRENIRLERALALRRICHERRIPTFNEMILGLPEQTYASFADGIAKAITPYPLDAFQLYLARIIENAEMATPEYRTRYGIDTRWVRIASFHREDDRDPVPEREEIVVATDAMPTDDWRRAFMLGYFVSAAHNLKLLDVVIQVAWRAAGLELRAFLERLLAGLPRIDAILGQYADAVVRGWSMVLPAPGTGRHLWAVEDAVVMTALSDAERFFAEVTACVAGHALMTEAVRWQRFIMPAPGDADERSAIFSYDFAAWRERDAGPVPRRARRFSWSPMAGLGGDLQSFMLAYLGAVHARVPTGHVRRAEHLPVTAAVKTDAR